MTYELNIAELDNVSGGTTIEEATALMTKWNAAITASGQKGIESAYQDYFGPHQKPPGGGGCHSSCH
jgi:hypothetical protein